MELSLSEALSPLTVPNLVGSHEILGVEDNRHYLPNTHHHISQGFPAVIPPPPPLFQLSSPVRKPTASTPTGSGAGTPASTVATNHHHHGNIQQSSIIAVSSKTQTTSTAGSSGTGNITQSTIMNESPNAGQAHATVTNGSNSTNNGSGIIVPTVDSIIKSSIHKKPLKDLTTIESILLLDLVCHPNRIPLGTIRYRINGEMLNHVKTGQDLAEIGLQFPRIILCSMAESIIKYQQEGVPLEIFPTTCSESSKSVLSGVNIGAMVSTTDNNNSNQTHDLTSSSVIPSSNTSNSTLVSVDGSISSSVSSHQQVSTTTSDSVESSTVEKTLTGSNSDQVQKINNGGGGKRVARSNFQDKPSPSPVILPTPSDSLVLATNAASSVALLKQQSAVAGGKDKSATPLSPVQMNDCVIPKASSDNTVIPKNVIFLHPTLTPVELAVISIIEKKILHDGYDIQTRFLPGSTPATAMNEWMHSQNGNMLIGAATWTLQHQQPGPKPSTLHSSQQTGGSTKGSQGKSAKVPKVSDKIETISKLDAEQEMVIEQMSAFEFIKHVLTLHCPISTKVGSKVVKALPASPASKKLLLTLKLLLFMLSLSKTVLENCPMQTQPGLSISFPIRRQDIDIIYEILKLALQIGNHKESLTQLGGGENNNKLEIIFDPIIDMATSHHKSFVPSSVNPSHHVYCGHVDHSHHCKSPAISTPVATNDSDCGYTSSLVPNDQKSSTQIGSESTCCELIGTTKICEVLIQMCKDFYSQVDLCVITCCAINDVTMQRHGFFTEYQDKFYDSGIASDLIRSLFLHKANGTAIQSICCAIIGLIANNPKNSKQFRDLGTFEVLVQVLRLHLVDVNVVERILDAMLRVAMIPEVNKNHDNSLNETNYITPVVESVSKPIRFKETGACELIVEVLSLHKTNSSVAVTASRIIGIMAMTVEHAIKLGQVGAVEELLEVLKIYISRENIEKYAASALRNLLCFEENKLKIHKIGACELILKIVLLHLNAVTVVDKLIGILLHLTSLTSSIATTNSDGHDSHHQQVSTVTSHGIPHTATNSASVSNHQNPLLSQKLHQQQLMKLGENGICLILVELLKEHKTEASIVKQACHTLNHVATIAENQRRLVDHNLFSVLVEVLAIHGQDAMIVSRVCDALNCIAIIPKARTPLVNPGGANGSTISGYVPERREVFIRHVPTRYVHLLAHMAPPNVPPQSNNHHHHHNANNSVGSGCSNSGSTPGPPPRVITNRHYFCNTISLKKNQSMLPFTEVGGFSNNGNVNNASEVLKNSKVLTYLQDCLTIHRENVRLEKKIRQTLMLMSCLS